MKSGKTIHVVMMSIITGGWFFTYFYMGHSLTQPNDQTGHAIGLFLLPIYWVFLANIFTGLMALAAYDNKRPWMNYVLSLSFLPTAWAILYYGFMYFERERIGNTHESWDTNFTLYPEMVQIIVVCSVISLTGGLTILLRGKKGNIT